jgi:hypothetical protein
MQTDRPILVDLFMAVAVMCGVTSCQRSNMVEIAGKVTINGKPLNEGTITFAPRNQPGPTAGTTVKNGGYSLRLFPGSKSVRIEGFRVVGERRAELAGPDSRMVPVKEQILPAKYNRQSSLSCEVESAGNDYHFLLHD